MSQPTVTINGTVYDAHTGMPINQNEQTPLPTESPKQTANFTAIHQRTQKSQTLHRRSVKKTVSEQEAPAPRKAVPPASSGHTISKFAPHPSGVKKGVVMSDIGPTAHPLANKTVQRQHQAMQVRSTPKQLKPAQAIKQEAIAEALDKAPAHNTAAKEHKKAKKYPRLMSLVSVSLALLLLGGYFTYLNLPRFSVRVAAAQAGVSATYPEYHPDGYSLQGPVAYSDGQVSMKFASNAGPQNFTVNQTKSGWDSSAVLDNYVKNKAGDNYITYNERGLTIYTFDGNAAWVNGGILYTISGDAPLSSDQIRRIATSM